MPVMSTPARLTRAVGSSLIRVCPRSTAIGAMAQRQPASRPAARGANPELSPSAAVARAATAPRSHASKAPKIPVSRQRSCPSIPKRMAGAISSGQPGG